MVKHFSHRHELQLQQQADEEETVICSGCECELDIKHSGASVYKCTKSNSNCGFYLHDLCFQLPREIHHNSHSNHPLLLSIPPYPDGEFKCNACAEFGTSFTYHCTKCKFDLHVHCAALTQTPIHRQDHEHPLTLLYSLPVGDVQQKMRRICDLCEGSISQACWLYYCKDCDYATHLHCSTAEADHE